MRIYKDLLRMMRFIKGPRTKTKMLVINHSLKEDQFINPKSYN